MYPCCHTECTEYLSSTYKLDNITNKYDIILNKILETKLFCLKHSRIYASIVCMNAKIIVTN
jgi:hypothetical protein